VLPVLLLHLKHAHPEAEVTLIDGDRFKVGNETRQVFRYFGNKAEVSARRFQEEYPGLHISFEPTYVTEENAISFIRENDLVVLCVDKHKVRKQVSDRCGELDNVSLVSGGNELTDGNIQIYLRRDGQDVTLPLANDLHEEIQNPEDMNPGEEGGCEQVVASKPQLVITNNLIAALMLAAIYDILQGETGIGEVYGDVLTISAVPHARKPQRQGETS
jgi:molybdopterin/thiamine biosynthesis adenylyltransferase